MLNAENKMEEFLKKVRATDVDFYLVDKFDEFAGWPMVAIPKVPKVLQTRKPVEANSRMRERNE